MAGSTPFVLPQYQGSMYDLQRQQALANALMQGALTQPQAPQAIGSGQYTVAPRMSALAPLSNIAQGLAGHYIGQQAGQGMNQLGQNQWQSLIGALGGGAAGQSPQLNPGSADGGVGVAGNAVDNPFAGADGGDGASAAPAAGPVNGVSAGPQLANNVGAGGSPLNPLGINPTMAAMMMMQSPDKYWETQAAAYKPADIVQQIRAAGIDPNSPLGHQLAQNALAKANYIAPTSLRPGGYAVYADGREEQLPQVPEGFTAVRGQNGWQIVPVQGGTEAMGASAAAKAGGKAQYELTDAWDPTANGGQGGMVRQTVSNAANAANGVPGFSPFQNAVRQVESGGRAVAVNPASGAAGSMQVTPTGAGSANPGFGVRPAANKSPAELQRVGADYATAMQQKYGNDADAAVAYNWGPANADKWIAAGRPWKMLPDETKAYVGQVMTQQQNYAGKPQGAAQGGPMASQPPLGAKDAANASQAAPSKQMADSYGALSTSDGSYQQSREALQEMIDLANKKGAGGMAVGLLPSGVSTRISPEAAKYQKLHATYVALQGKALGAGGTNEARATINESVPTYDKPQSAMVSGLQTQLNNLDLAHLKTQYLTPTYQKGDEKAYTAQSAAFDQNIKPSMIGALQMQGDQQRAAVQAAIKANPSLRANFEWAFNNGMLK